jgi:hypothetical protein
MAERAYSALEELVTGSNKTSRNPGKTPGKGGVSEPLSELQMLELNPSEKTPALWRAFAEVVAISPGVVSSFLSSRPEIVEWLASAPPEVFHILWHHDSNEIKELARKVTWWLGRRWWEK